MEISQGVLAGLLVFAILVSIAGTLVNLHERSITGLAVLESDGVVATALSLAALALVGGAFVLLSVSAVKIVQKKRKKES